MVWLGGNVRKVIVFVVSVVGNGTDSSGCVAEVLGA